MVVGRIGYAMGVITILPDFTFAFVADGERETTFDELDAAFNALVGGGCQQSVQVIGHDDEAVELEAALFAVAEKGRHHEVGVGGALEDAVSLVRDRSDGEGLGIDSNSWVGKRRHISGAKAQFVVVRYCPG